jgi:chorismate-pyruvate lyase
MTPTIDDRVLGPEHELVNRHFAMQADRPAGVEAVEIARLDPFLRSLLFTDGTVTRALGVHTLAPILVDVVSQARVPLPADLAGYLESSGEEESLRRRVGIGAGSPAAPVLWAESYILPRRLPPAFLGLLDRAPDGIGGSLQREKLESWRELLWFGLSRAPEWTPEPASAGDGVLTRLYRVTAGGAPAMLIAESFAIERQGDAYRLAAAS